MTTKINMRAATPTKVEATNNEGMFEYAARIVTNLGTGIDECIKDFVDTREIHKVAAEHSAATRDAERKARIQANAAEYWKREFDIELEF